MIEVSLTGLNAPAQEVALCRAQYQQNCMLVLPGLFSRELCEILIREINAGGWYQAVHEDNGVIGSEETSSSELAGGILSFVVTEPGFISLIRQISGRDDITWFSGRFFKMNPSLGHSCSWHDDINPTRRVGISICLEEVPCEGGGFEIRKAGSDQLLGRVERRNLGDATLFRIGEDLEHRILPVKEGTVRVACAGWFHSGRKDLQTRLAKNALTSDHALG